MDYGLKGKHVLVSGGATGIGLAVAQAFVAEGASATISGLAETEVVTAVAQLGDRARGMACDLTVVGEDRRLADFARAAAPLIFSSIPSAFSKCGLSSRRATRTGFASSTSTS